ncbi:DUF5998 family protein [Arsenicicoccus piscis]|nr:DUF5998 family protein [Arsenicicoccus piscis]MCH8628593.1 DUF5998 family protein [Arsenicicoccus piscis]
MRSAAPAPLVADLELAGYYPALVADVAGEALAGEELVEHLVHQETTFDRDEILRHITVLALTPTRLIVCHVDDHQDHPVGVPRTGRAGEKVAETTVTATSESVPLSAVRGVTLTHVVPAGGRYRPGTLGSEVTLTLGWGALSRLELMPATCGDPSCDADHGYDGAVTGDDISLRVSADADGAPAVARARAFARALSLASAR